MNRHIKNILFTGILLIVGSSACNLIFSQKSPLTPGPSVTPMASATALPTEFPTMPVPTASSTPEFAPYCEEDAASVLPSTSCQVPVAEESSRYCYEKDPYNLILLNKGSTFEVLTKHFRCTDAGMKNDRQMVACTGLMATTFEINVCNPACVIPTAQAGMTNCPPGYNLNTLNGCCTQEVQQLNPGCMVFKFDTITCVANCDKIVRKSQCLKNQSACIWDQEKRLCKLRE